MIRDALERVNKKKRLLDCVNDRFDMLARLSLAQVYGLQLSLLCDGVFNVVEVVVGRLGSISRIELKSCDAANTNVIYLSFSEAHGVVIFCYDAEIRLLYNGSSNEGRIPPDCETVRQFMLMPSYYHVVKAITDSQKWPHALKERAEGYALCSYLLHGKSIFTSDLARRLLK